MKDQRIRPHISPEVKKRIRKCRTSRLAKKRLCELKAELCSLAWILAGAYVCAGIVPCRKINDLKTCPREKRK